MSDKRYEANIIRATAVEPANNLESTSAPGVWSIDEVVELQKKNKWPTVGNVATDVDDVFSTFVYQGTSATKVVDNGINLSGEGGLVWTKLRDTSTRHVLIDTARGVEKYLESNASDAEDTQSSNSLTAFNNNGYTIGNWGSMNSSSYKYVSWTFRKAPKFFDIVTYTGNNSTQTINHNLGSVPGMIIVKRLNDAGNWGVKHRSIAATNAVFLNRSDQSYANSTYWGDTEPTSTQFTVGTTHSVSGAPYVAYLFAHNDSDGEFGPNQDQDIIKCGSISGYNGRAELGFEPQWVLLKSSNYNSTNWIILDVIRGWTPVNSNDDAYLWANLTNAEADYNGPSFDATGFNFGQSGDNYIYMAIRRGPLAAPTDATKVFGMDAYTSGGDGPVTGFVTDFSLLRLVNNAYDWYATTRLTGKVLYTNQASAEVANQYAITDRMDGMWDTAVPNHFLWGWKRAPGYFDVVAYTGTGVSGRTVNHSLGVVPEMIWVKRRSGVNNWMVYAGDATDYLRLNTTDPTSDGDFAWNDTAPTASVFSVGNHNLVNGSGETYIAYLFATVAGVSKVGSYTGDGTTGRVIDCGFTSGAKFVVIKPTSQTGSWIVYDTARGIIAGNDPFLQLNNTPGQVTDADDIDPDNSGFIVNQATGNYLNQSSVDYIFYAIAT